MRLRVIANLAFLPVVAHAQASPRAIATSGTLASLERPSPGSWPQNGRDYHNQRYSPLRQLTTDNVGRLAPRMVFQLQMAQPNAGAEATPIVVDGRLYVSADYNVVTAFDLRTKRQLWRYAPTVDKGKPCCGPVNRGVAMTRGMVYLGTIDARVIALDATTGQLRWEAANADPDSGYSITMAPVIVGDRVIVGTSGGEFPTRGSVTAYDASTGARLWRWYAIPSPDEGGWWGKWAATAPTGESLGRNIEQERADSAAYADSWRSGGGPVWAQPAYDAESGTLFVVVGNPAPSNDGRRRPGDNLYTGSIVALDVATGTMRWYFQAVPHDVWDYDLATPPVIVADGNRKLLLVPSKMGWVYVLRARNALRLHADSREHGGAEGRTLDRREADACRGGIDVRDHQCDSAVDGEDRVATPNGLAVERRTRNRRRLALRGRDRRLAPGIRRTHGPHGVGVLLRCRRERATRELRVGLASRSSRCSLREVVTRKLGDRHCWSSALMPVAQLHRLRPGRHRRRRSRSSQGRGHPTARSV